MADNDNPVPTEEEALEEFRRELRSDLQKFQESIDASLRSLCDCMERNAGAMQQDAELSKRLEDMNLAPEQEMLLYSVLTLPPEALGLLREHLGIAPKQA
jgi:hypothetical protein